MNTRIKIGKRRLEILIFHQICSCRRTKIIWLGTLLFEIKLYFPLRRYAVVAGSLRNHIFCCLSWWGYYRSFKSIKNRTVGGNARVLCRIWYIFEQRTKLSIWECNFTLLIKLFSIDVWSKTVWFSISVRCKVLTTNEAELP